VSLSELRDFVVRFKVRFWGLPEVLWEGKGIRTMSPGLGVIPDFIVGIVPELAHEGHSFLYPLEGQLNEGRRK